LKAVAPSFLEMLVVLAGDCDNPEDSGFALPGEMTPASVIIIRSVHADTIVKAFSEAAPPPIPVHIQRDSIEPLADGTPFGLLRDGEFSWFSPLARRSWLHTRRCPLDRAAGVRKS
jgi:hypothetical protein